MLRDTEKCLSLAQMGQLLSEHFRGPPRGQTNTSEYITFPQTSLAGGNNRDRQIYYLA